MPGYWAYNDSITRPFRALARTGVSIPHKSVSFAYVDATKQAAFVKAFGPLPSDMSDCNSGESGRYVSDYFIHV